MERLFLSASVILLYFSLSFSQSAPVISVEPKDTTVFLENPASLFVGITGTGPFSFAWYRSAVAPANLISDQTGSMFALASAQMSDSGSYICVVSDPNGSDTSRAARIKVGMRAPVITVEPHDTTVWQGKPVTLTVTATGAGPFTFAWYRTSIGPYNLLSGQPGNVLSISSAQVSDSGNYLCVVSNPYGSDTSRVARIAVIRGIGPKITVEPKDVTVWQESPISLTVEVTGTAPLKFGWRKTARGSTTVVSGQTGDTLAIAGAQMSDSGAYSCIVSNLYGSDTSRAAYVTIRSRAPVITIQPQDATVLQGGPVSLIVGTTGTGPFTFAWYKNAVSPANVMAGQTGSMFSITKAQLADSGFYLCVVSSQYGTATSRAAHLTVEQVSGVLKAERAGPCDGVGSIQYTVIDQRGRTVGTFRAGRTVHPRNLEGLKGLATGTYLIPAFSVDRKGRKTSGQKMQRIYMP